MAFSSESDASVNGIIGETNSAVGSVSLGAGSNLSFGNDIFFNTGKGMDLGAENGANAAAMIKIIQPATLGSIVVENQPASIVLTSRASLTMPEESIADFFGHNGTLKVENGASLILTGEGSDGHTVEFSGDTTFSSMDALSNFFPE